MTHMFYFPVSCWCVHASEPGSDMYSDLKVLVSCSCVVFMHSSLLMYVSAIYVLWSFHVLFLKWHVRHDGKILFLISPSPLWFICPCVSICERDIPLSCLCFYCECLQNKLSWQLTIKFKTNPKCSDEMAMNVHLSCFHLTCFSFWIFFGL